MGKSLPLLLDDRVMILELCCFAYLCKLGDRVGEHRPIKGGRGRERKRVFFRSNRMCLDVNVVETGKG